jgi:hypothetical protein
MVSRLDEVLRQYVAGRNDGPIAVIVRLHLRGFEALGLVHVPVVDSGENQLGPFFQREFELQRLARMEYGWWLVTARERGTPRLAQCFRDGRLKPG